MTKTGAFLLALAALAAAFPQPAPANEPDLQRTEERPDAEQLVRYFETIVFGSEFKGVNAFTSIRKWTRPLRVVVREYGEVVTPLAGGRVSRRLEAEPVSKQHLDYVQRHLNTLADLTGLKTQDARKTRWPANFTINFVPPLQLANPELADVPGGILQRLAAQGGCYFLIWPDDSGETLQKAVIVVNKGRTPDRTAHCVLEEMTQSLGLPNDSNPAWPSIFANSGAIQQLSWADRILVRTLYDPRMKPGLARADALELARTIISELIAK